MPESETNKADDIHAEQGDDEISYLFRRDGKTWTLCFNGKTITIIHLVGMNYIAHLLRHPGENIPITELNYAVKNKPSPEKGKFYSGMSDDQLDEYRLRNVSGTDAVGFLTIPFGL